MIVFDALERPVFDLAKNSERDAKTFVILTRSITMQFHISLENFKLRFTAGWAMRGLDMRVTHIH